MVSRGSNKSNNTGGRDVTTPSLATLLRPPTNHFLIIRPEDIMPSDDIRTLEDRRQFHPARRIQTPAAVVRKATRIVQGYHPRSLNFRIPNMIAICARRKIRKEVLHAFRKAGKGGQKKRKVNYWSRIGC